MRLCGRHALEVCTSSRHGFWKEVPTPPPAVRNAPLRQAMAFCSLAWHWFLTPGMQNASAENRIRATSMATRYSTTRPLMLGRCGLGPGQCFCCGACAAAARPCCPRCSRSCSKQRRGARCASAPRHAKHGALGERLAANKICLAPGAYRLLHWPSHSAEERGVEHAPTRARTVSLSVISRTL
jgi:hypothetical protein